MFTRQRHPIARLLLVGLVAFASESIAVASDDDEAGRGLGLFHDYVQPLLSQNCYECHSHEAKKAKGGLVLDSRETIRKGGDLGPAVVPGDVDASLLIEAVSYHNADLQMPPDNRLSSEDVARLVEWIELGAPDPREGMGLAKLGDTHWNGPTAEDL